MDNIFSALIHRRDRGVIIEFVLWCILCFEVLFAMVAAVAAGSRATWILLLLFIMGLAVMMAFRLTAIALLYSVGVFHLITLTVQYICYRPSSIMNIFVFVLLTLLTLAALVCSFVHNFSKADLGKVVMVLVVTDSVFIVILQIMLHVGSRSMWAQGIEAVSGLLGLGRSVDRRGYWVGTICFWILLVVIDLYYIFFVLGLIDNSWNKIVRKPSRPVRPSPPSGHARPAGIQGMSGAYAGRVVYMDNRELLIGSDRAAGATVVIPAAYVSRAHCAVRYIPGGNGFYEVCDRSTNGVYLVNGNRLPQNVWNRLPRGSVICIGGMAQQLRLL